MTSDDCRVSCTGLYADVTQWVQDKTDGILEQISRGEETLSVIFLGIVKYKAVELSLLNDYYELKKTEDKQMSNYMDQYTTYKESFVKSVMFDPSTDGLSMFYKKHTNCV